MYCKTVALLPLGTLIPRESSVHFLEKSVPNATCQYSTNLMSFCWKENKLYTLLITSNVRSWMYVLRGTTDLPSASGLNCSIIEDVLSLNVVTRLFKYLQNLKNVIFKQDFIKTFQGFQILFSKFIVPTLLLMVILKITYSFSIAGITVYQSCLC